MTTLVETSVEPKVSVVGRLAPSPTGLLHLGHAFAFCVAWWSARAQRGKVVLRFDDLDEARSSQHYIDQALYDLTWLGLDWDGAPVLESSRKADLDARADMLEAHGLAYACVCSRGDLRHHALSAPHAADVELCYPGTCRDRFATRTAAERQTGRSAALRLRVQLGPVRVHDENYGELFVDVARTVGDFPIVRRDRSPAYQFAVVVDDDLDGVTEVVRGRDLLESTARQRLVQKALGLKSPTTCHVPLIVDAQGRRLAKRDDSRSLSQLRAEGVDPRTIVAWAARVAGQTEEPRTTAAEVLRVFERGRLGRADIVAPDRFEPGL